MNRRDLLKTLGAIGIAPMIPSLPTLATASSMHVPIVTEKLYSTAEMLVRAHKKCSPAMLQRLLGLDATVAELVKSQLLKNGVISTNVNAYGLHSAVKPLYEGAFVKDHNMVARIANDVKLKQHVESEHEEPTLENESDISELEALDESPSEQAESSLEETKLVEDMQDYEDSKTALSKPYGKII